MPGPSAAPVALSARQRELLQTLQKRQTAEELKERVLAFIEYFNQTMARPIRWLYSPRPLKDPPPTG